jgi:hypothetical protein
MQVAFWECEEMHSFGNKYNNNVVSEGAETHSWSSSAQETPPQDCRSRGFPGQRPSRVCFCSLRNHTSLVLYLSYATKTTEKQLLILQFHIQSSPWCYADVATTLRRPVQQYARHHWDSAMTLTQQTKSIYQICCIRYFYTTPGYRDSIAVLHG